MPPINLLTGLWTPLQEQFLHSLIRILVEAVVLSNAPTSWLFCVFSLFVLFLRTLCYSKKKRKKSEGLGAYVRRQRPADRPTTNVPHSKSSNTRIEKWQIKCNPLRNTYQARQKHIWWQVEGYVVHSLGTSKVQTCITIYSQLSICTKRSMMKALTSPNHYSASCILSS